MKPLYKKIILSIFVVGVLLSFAAIANAQKTALNLLSEAPIIGPFARAASIASPLLNKLADQGGFFKWLDPDQWFPAVITLAGTYIIAAVSVFTGICGTFFNFAINLNIVRMTGIVNSLDFITDSWTFFRDALNLFFIFSLLYIAITTILGQENGGTKKLLGNLIIAALLINFSLFITKAVIDVSNIASFGFAKQLPEFGYGDNVAALAYETTNTGPAGSVMDALKLTTIYDAREALADDFAEIAATTPKLVTAVIMSSIFLIGLAFLYLTAAILFTIRFVLLILLMVTSPFMFAGMVLPALSGISEKWWSTFWHQIFFAPAFMMLFMLALKFVTSPGFNKIVNTSDASFMAFFADAGNGTISIVFNYFIAMAMLISAVAAAKSLGATGAEFAGKVGGKLSFGLAAGLARSTVGRMSYQYTKNKARRDWATESWVGEQAMKVNRFLSERSFDLRNIAGAAKPYVGEPHEGGYRGSIKKSDEEKKRLIQRMTGTSTKHIARQLKFAKRKLAWTGIEEYKDPATGETKLRGVPWKNLLNFMLGRSRLEFSGYSEHIADIMKTYNKRAVTSLREDLKKLRNLLEKPLVPALDAAGNPILDADGNPKVTENFSVIQRGRTLANPLASSTDDDANDMKDVVFKTKKEVEEQIEKLTNRIGQINEEVIGED